MILLPIKTDSPLRGVPWMNWLLIGVNVLMFLLQEARPLAVFGEWPLNVRRPELYQFFTYAFLHGDIMHLVSNMLFLYIFGNNICDRLGNWGYLAFYLAGGVFAATGYAALKQQGMVIGASGAVAAVTGAYLALLPRSHITIFYWLFILIGLYEIPSLWLIGFFFVQDVFFSFSRASGVAYLAHVSGSIFGFMVSLLLLKSRLLPRDHFDMLALIDRWNRRRQYQAVVNGGYDPFNYTTASVPEGVRASPAGPQAFSQMQDLRAQISEAMAHNKMDEAAALYQQLRQLDANQVLAKGAQLDVANHLYGRGAYREAADTYELYLRTYGENDQTGRVHLMLGLAYGRYLNDPEKAKSNLTEAVRRLQFEREAEVAKAELARLGGAGA